MWLHQVSENFFLFKHNLYFWLHTIIAKVVLVSVSTSAPSGTSRRGSEHEHGICTVTKLVSSELWEGVTVSYQYLRGHTWPHCQAVRHLKEEGKSKAQAVCLA